MSLLYDPENSLISQSRHARETEYEINADGFGLGWYANQVSIYPGVFRSIQPAWNDMNLKHLSRTIASGCFISHVRAATSGGVGLVNCHPFRYKQYLFAHNGDIEGFSVFKRHVREKLDNTMYDWIQGQTDSEHLCALFCDKLINTAAEPTGVEIADALIAAIKDIREMQCHYVGKDKKCHANVIISDGRSLIACRYSSGTHSQTLYYQKSTISKLHNIQSVLVASEKLDDIADSWCSIDLNYCNIFYEDMTIDKKFIVNT